jgi:hypothetical protein
MIGGVEPDLSLLKPRRFGVVPALLILFLAAGGTYLVFMPGPPVPKPVPQPKPTAQAPLLVTLAPPTPDAAPGWCCIERTLVETTRAACKAAKGTFSTTQAAAPAACRPASPAAPAVSSRATSGSPRGPGTGG